MFDIGWGELVVIGIAALIFIGPKELPGVLRTLGQAMAKVRRMAGEFQNQFQDAMREAELAELRKEVDEMATEAANYSNFDPLADVRKEFENTGREIDSALADKPAGTPTDAPPVASPSPDATTPETVPAADLPAPAAPREGAAADPSEPAQEPVEHAASGSKPA
jgi:sec-independent protein translocase protein TatB